MLLAVPPAAVEQFRDLCAGRGQAAWEIGVAAAPADRWAVPHRVWLPRLPLGVGQGNLIAAR